MASASCYAYLSPRFRLVTGRRIPGAQRLWERRAPTRGKGPAQANEMTNDQVTAHISHLTANSAIDNYSSYV